MNATYIAAHDLRAAFNRELLRLAARPWLGGPHCAIREGVLLAWMPGQEGATVIDQERMEALARVEDAAGPEKVGKVLSW